MCRNCGTPLGLGALTPWCTDCVRAWLKGVAGAVGTGCGLYLVRWLS